MASWRAKKRQKWLKEGAAWWVLKSENHAMKMLLLLSLASLLPACSASPVMLPVAPLPPPGGEIILLDRIHLGDDLADGQAFVFGPSIGARVCSLVNVPAPTEVYVEVRGLRLSESLADLLTINGEPHALPITLERGFFSATSNAMETSAGVWTRLAPGPSEICLVAGRRLSGDIDDFEVSAVVMHLRGVDPGQIGVRSLAPLGAPPQPYRPSTPWGQWQQPPTGPQDPCNQCGYRGYGWRAR